MSGKMKVVYMDYSVLSNSRGNCHTGIVLVEY